MHPAARSLLPVLFAALLFQGFTASRVTACQYCEMASDPSQNVYLPPTDPSPAPVAGTQLTAQPPSTPPVLSAASNVATRLSDLPAGTPLAAKRAARRLPPTASTTALPPRPLTPVAAPATVANLASTRRPTGTRWADMGLLGIVAAGGVFCWRTRRAV